MDILELLPEGLKIETPFTWGLDKSQVDNFNEEDTVLADYEESPITRFVEMNTFAYIRSVKGKTDGAEKLIEEINDLWKNIYESASEKKDYSVDVLKHIKDATAYCIYLMSGKKDQAKNMEVKDADNFTSDVEKATIFGCQALASTLFNESSLDSALKSAKLAVTYAPKCAVWHYVIAKCLRKKRCQNNGLDVSVEERNEFLICYKLSPSDHYGISLARMYKESRNWKKCLEIQNEIYRRNPSNIKVRLVLALGFMNSKEFVKSKNCLDYIKNLLPPEKRSKTYYHYLGKYYDKTGNYSEAKENYIKALGDHTGNFSADMDYLKLIKNFSNSKNNTEVIKHLENMLKRYEDHKDRSLNIFLNLAFIYLFKNKDLKLAADNFLKALKINSRNPQLKNFHSAFDPKKKYNVFQVIRENILIENENGYGDTLKELKSYCTECENPKKMINALDSLDTEFVKAFAKTMSLKE